MNPRTKIFIAENDCASLVSLMLWLEQFPEFEVEGAAISGADWIARINEHRPDVVLLDSTFFRPENLPSLRAVKSGPFAPGILVKTVNNQQLDSLIANEADETLGSEASIKDLCEAIRKAANKRRVALSAANMPITLAG